MRLAAKPLTSYSRSLISSKRILDSKQRTDNLIIEQRIKRTARTSVCSPNLNTRQAGLVHQTTHTYTTTNDERKNKSENPLQLTASWMAWGIRKKILQSLELYEMSLQTQQQRHLPCVPKSKPGWLPGNHLLSTGNHSHTFRRDTGNVQKEKKTFIVNGKNDYNNPSINPLTTKWRNLSLSHLISDDNWRDQLASAEKGQPKKDESNRIWIKDNFTSRSSIPLQGFFLNISYGGISQQC